jgi:NAD(P)H-nitrite reductase large subunit
MNSGEYSYLIIGNSVAGIAAAEAIGGRDSEGSIAIVSAETQNAYSRPLISYLLGGQVDEQTMLYRDDDWYARHGIVLMAGRRAVSLDSVAHRVTLDDGTDLRYSKLLLATGGRPVVPDIPGKGLAGVFTFTTWDDARAIESFIGQRGVTDAVVVGAGLIGLKAAEALMARGIRVTMVELGERVLGMTFDARASEIAREIIRRAGATVLTGNTVTSVLGEAGLVSGVTLQQGGTLPCGMVVMAIGVRPATELAESGGVRVDRGILVNERMETSAADVYAAGDVAQGPGFVGFEQVVVPIWPDAFRQGAVAGGNMAGGEIQFDGSLVMNSVSICGVPTISAGATGGGEGCEALVHEDPSGRSYRRIVVRDDRVIGCVFIGNIERAGIVVGLIRRRADVGKFKEALMANDFGLISLPREMRKHMVSGTAIEV